MKIGLILFALAFSMSAAAQQTQLLPQDSVYLARLHKELAIESPQKHKVDSIYIHYTTEMYKLDAEIKKVQQSDLSEDSINKEVSRLNEERKLKKDLRELDLIAVLNEQQKKVYIEKIKPAKPQVLHFGINHDRASCVICE